MGERIYYSSWFRLNQADGYFIWYSNEPDGVILTDEKKIEAYNSLERLEKVAQDNGVIFSDQKPILLDLDKLQKWLEPSKKRRIDCDSFLNAWNLFDDVSVSISGNKVEVAEADAEEINRIYIRMFWGNNLPAVTPEGKKFIPKWSERELVLIKKVMKKGLQEFQNRLQIIA